MITFFNNPGLDSVPQLTLVLSLSRVVPDGNAPRMEK